MQKLSLCFKACKTEECLVECLNNVISVRTTGGYLSIKDFDETILFLLENVKENQYDSVILFTEMWNSYEKNIQIMASYLVPVYMKNLNAEQEMVLFSALSTIEDKDLISPLSCKISEAYQPELKQWPLFLEKLSLSENEHLTQTYTFIVTLLAISEKIIDQNIIKPRSDIVNQKVEIIKEMAERTIQVCKDNPYLELKPKTPGEMQ
jgi:hypothetical protein